jgi:hypothetical protein
MACGRARKRDGHSSRAPVTRRLQQPTRTAVLDIDLRRRRSPAKSSRRPYSVLLPVGFAMPPALPPARCALTAPFHPYRDNTLRAAAVCSLWHFPWARARRTLSGTACPWSPDFPLRQPFGFAAAAVRPTDQNRDGGPRTRRQEASRARAATERTRPRCASKSFSVASVDSSAIPSTRSGRKWR